MSDLIERLGKLQDSYNKQELHLIDTEYVWELAGRTADEIERLTAELKALAEGNIKRWDDSCAMATEIERKDKVIEVLRDEAIDYHDIKRVNKILAEHDKEE